MPSHDEVAETFESQEVIFSQHAVDEALQIEEVLNRAYEIRRAHGGLFGYDLEDWLQAERELAERNRTDKLRVEETAHEESKQIDQERNWNQCLGINNET
jgi:Protein of unknown function (DUF2934)